MRTARAADGATLAYDVRGAGPPLVLVHGITESHHAWDPLIDELALDARVIAVDLRGHGESERRPPYDVFTMAEDLDAVLTAAGVNEPIVVGHSLGGVVVTLYASMHPVRAVVNVDQSLEVSGFKEFLTAVEPSLRGDDAEFQALVASLVEGLYGPLDRQERDRLERLARRDQEVVVGCWDQLLTTDTDEMQQLIEATVRTISVPYLALHGSAPSDSYGAWLASLIPSATFEVWDGDGHYPHLVERDRFLERLHEFEHSL
jgi:pimeloyl-ACP methyl ester carboxylesterase